MPRQPHGVCQMSPEALIDPAKFRIHVTSFLDWMPFLSLEVFRGISKDVNLHSFILLMRTTISCEILLIRMWESRAGISATP